MSTNQPGGNTGCTDSSPSINTDLIGRHAIKRSEADGFISWIRGLFAVPDDVTIDIEDRGMHGSRRVILTAPDHIAAGEDEGESEDELTLSAYCSRGLAPHYKVTMRASVLRTLATWRSALTEEEA